MNINTQVGPQVAQDGALPIARSARTGELVTSDAHGRFYEACVRGNMYRGGMTTTSINAATFTTATTGATATPIAGVWNPVGSNTNLVLLQIGITVNITALTNTGPGGFAYSSSILNSALTLGSAPFNCKTGLAVGSVAKDMSGVALTGLTTTLTVRMGAGVAGGSIQSFSVIDTAAGLSTIMLASVENFDGSLIVPPGGVWGLFCTTTPVAHSATSYLLWEEVAV